MYTRIYSDASPNHAEALSFAHEHRDLSHNNISSMGPTFFDFLPHNTLGWVQAVCTENTWLAGTGTCPPNTAIFTM